MALVSVPVLLLPAHCAGESDFRGVCCCGYFNKEYFLFTFAAFNRLEADIVITPSRSRPTRPAGREKYIFMLNYIRFYEPRAYL